MKLMYGLMGTVSMSVGVLGIILPILPTTPFLLLSMYMYSKASDKAEQWFKNTVIYKKYLQTFVQTKAMDKKKKWVLLLGVDIMLIITFINVSSLLLRILIGILIVIKHWYFHTKIKSI